MMPTRWAAWIARASTSTNYAGRRIALQGVQEIRVDFDRVPGVAVRLWLPLGPDDPVGQALQRLLTEGTSLHVVPDGGLFSFAQLIGQMPAELIRGWAGLEHV